MAQQQRKKAHTHGVAARSKAATSQQKVPEPVDALGAAAVVATFGDDAVAPVDEEANDELTDSHALSRGQRKRLKRRAAFMRKMGIMSRMAQKQQNQAKLAEDGVFAGLDELKTSLFQDDRKKQAKAGKKKPLSGHQRQKLAVRELGQLKAVQTHSSFKSDPFAAIQTHLQNTIVQANQELLQKSIKKIKVNTMDIEA